jgi:hypothetical protein
VLCYSGFHLKRAQGYTYFPQDILRIFISSSFVFELVLLAEALQIILKVFETRRGMLPWEDFAS